MRIVAATFGATVDVGALDYAVDVALAGDGTLFAVHAVRDDTGAPDAEWHASDPATAGLEAVERAERLAAAARLPVETAVLRGEVAATVPGYLAANDADLLVVARPPDARRTGADRVVARLVDATRVPVTVVPASLGAPSDDRAARPPGPR